MSKVVERKGRRVRGVVGAAVPETARKKQEERTSMQGTGGKDSGAGVAVSKGDGKRDCIQKTRTRGEEKRRGEKVKVKVAHMGEGGIGGIRYRP